MSKQNSRRGRGLRLEDFNLNKDRYLVIKQQVEDVLYLMWQTHHRLELYNDKPVSKRQVAEFVDDVTDRMEQLQRGVAKVDEHLREVLDLLPELIEERDLLDEANEDCVSKSDFMTWFTDKQYTDD